MMEQEGVVVKQALGLVTLWSSGSPRRVLNPDTEEEEEDAYMLGSQGEREKLTYLFVWFNCHHRGPILSCTWRIHMAVHPPLPHKLGSEVGLRWGIGLGQARARAGVRLGPRLRQAYLERPAICLLYRAGCRRPPRDQRVLLTAGSGLWAHQV